MNLCVIYKGIQRYFLTIFIPIISTGESLLKLITSNHNTFHIYKFLSTVVPSSEPKKLTSIKGIKLTLHLKKVKILSSK